MYWANVSERQAATPPLAVSTVVFALREPDAETDAERQLQPDAQAAAQPVVAQPTAAPEGAHPASGTSSNGPTLWVPLVRRTREPYLGQWALPGGPLRGDTSLRGTAAATLRDTTGLAPTLLEQLYTFGGTDRGEGTRTVSVVYWALVRLGDADTTLTDDPDVAWFRADDPAVLAGLAFDHRQILEYALARLRAKVSYGEAAHGLLAPAFTLAPLRAAPEATLSEDLDPANFRRTVLASGTVQDTGEVLTGGRNRPPRLYTATATAERARAGLPDPEGDPA